MKSDGSQFCIVFITLFTTLLVLSGCWLDPNPPNRAILEHPGVTPITDVQDRLTWRDPAWSPDGKQIAVVNVKGPNAETLEMYLVDVTTGALRQITDAEPLGQNGAPSWSPDGNRVGLYSNEFEQAGVGYLDLESGDAVWIAASGELEWLPDGHRVAFLTASEEGTQSGGGIAIAVRDLDTGLTSLIWHNSTNYVYFGSMEWARNADLLALSLEAREDTEGWETFNRDIHVIDTSGHHEVVIATEADETSPTWSPDATMLAFGKGEYNESTLWVTNADGSCSVQLLDIEGITEPTWSPDGKRIAFIYSFDLYVLDLTVEPIAQRLQELECQE